MPALLALGLVMTMGAVSVLSGMWVTLQFKWIALQYPAVTMVFERSVVTAALPVAAVMHMLGLAMVSAQSGLHPGAGAAHTRPAHALCPAYACAADAAPVRSCCVMVRTAGVRATCACARSDCALPPVRADGGRGGPAVLPAGGAPGAGATPRVLPSRVVVLPPKPPKPPANMMMMGSLLLSCSLC